MVEHHIFPYCLFAFDWSEMYAELLLICILTKVMPQKTLFSVITALWCAEPMFKMDSLLQEQ